MCLIQEQGRHTTPYAARPSYLRPRLCTHTLIVLSLLHTAWAKDEPPSPTDYNHEPPSPGGSRGPTDSDVASYYKSPVGTSGEHRWFPFTRRRPVLASDMFGADPSTPVRLEKRPSILRSPSLGPGFARSREDRSPARGGTTDQARTTSPRARDRSLRIAMPATPAIPYTLSHSRTPGWDSPWTAKPIESLSHRNIYEQLRNGETSEEHSPDTGTTNDNWWPRTRKRARAYLLNNTYVPLVKYTRSLGGIHRFPLTTQ